MKPDQIKASTIENKIIGENQCGLPLIKRNEVNFAEPVISQDNKSNRSGIWRQVFKNIYIFFSVLL